MGVRLLLALCAVHAVHLVHPAVGADSCDSKLRPRSPQNELRDHLLCNYDFNRAALSTYEKNVTSASQFVVLNSIDYIEWGSRKEAIINTLQNWTWYDVRLIWNPNSYHGISSIWLDPQRIWTPDAMFVDLMESLEFAGGRCRVTSAGHVTCSATSAPRVACEAHLASWPHDGATCTLYQVAGDMALEKLDLNLDSEDAASKLGGVQAEPHVEAAEGGHRSLGEGRRQADIIGVVPLQAAEAVRSVRRHLSPPGTGAPCSHPGHVLGRPGEPGAHAHLLRGHLHPRLPAAGPGLRAADRRGVPQDNSVLPGLDAGGRVHDACGGGAAVAFLRGGRPAILVCARRLVARGQALHAGPAAGLGRGSKQSTRGS
ncbi:uncharacterized protein LOC134540477 isoform X4 [Bacillus rossius redtenbacheri]|uniref:uncharacterized protein LOC134540477 isoform X4 n=1 Tax=Bacillus rossius redtenbacheri TaxID=93214 RepID=UPI002FDDFEA6